MEALALSSEPEEAKNQGTSQIPHKRLSNVLGCNQKNTLLTFFDCPNGLERELVPKLTTRSCSMDFLKDPESCLSQASRGQKLQFCFLSCSLADYQRRTNCSSKNQVKIYIHPLKGPLVGIVCPYSAVIQLFLFPKLAQERKSNTGNGKELKMFIQSKQCGM